MNIIDIITKKKNKETLSEQEINYFINKYVGAEITDYQASALLMAICINGMNSDEEFFLTKAMVESGNVIDLSSIDGICVDKHSTGGIGDKTTLVVGPILAACGLKVAKMSGRGLGYTGGTIDKLESIPNFVTFLNEKDFFNQINQIGISIIGQTGNLVPADKKIYALRDVTGTIDSVSLIAASIMSKKIASGAPFILLDIKVGKGAFMKTKEEAKLLANSMINIAKSYNRKIVCMLTDMNQPLGNNVGNSLEVIEAIETLKGHGNLRFIRLCEEICSQILIMTNKAPNKIKALAQVRDVIKSLTALEKLSEMIRLQKGDCRVIDNYDLFPKAKNIEFLRSSQKGFVTKIDALSVGKASMLLGAGRMTKEDKIDLSAGIELLINIGDMVEENTPIVKIYHSDKNLVEAITLLKKAFTISGVAIKEEDIIIEIIK